MGTYARIVLKETVTEKELKKINRELSRRGIPIAVHEDVEYGAFITNETMVKDVRFMNEDPEGLKQMPGIPRPVTIDQVICRYFYKPRLFCRKIRYEDKIREVAIVVAWAEEHPELIDQDESSYWQREEIDSTLMRPLSSFV
jgi:hypothetical protein